MLGRPNLDDNFSRSTEHWRPKVVTALHGQKLDRESKPNSVSV
jgi:hypothetical protein